MDQNNPIDRKYSKENEWFLLEKNVVTCGITQFAQDQLSDVVFVEFPEIGKVLKEGDSAAVLESVKSVSDLYFYGKGTVMEVNSRLEDEPDLINKDPFGQGWVLKIKVEDTSFMDQLMDAQSYDQFTQDL